jgi:hypothetical protein
MDNPMEEPFAFTQELVEIWSAELDEQAWWILVEQLKACNTREMQELGQGAYEILEVLGEVEGEIAARDPLKQQALAQLQEMIRGYAFQIMQGHEELASKLQHAEDGMGAFKALFLEYDALRTRHRFLVENCAVELDAAREEGIRRKLAAKEEAMAILRAAQAPIP